MNTFLYVDIEVIPNLTEHQLGKISDSIKPPGNYKNQATIDKWAQTVKPGILKEKIHKACFDELTGQIICIGTAVEDQPPVVLCGTETEILMGLFTIIQAIFEERKRFPTIVGHNAIAFDVPYIWRRAKVLGITIPYGYPSPPALKAWSDKVADTMIMWAGIRNKVSLDNLATGLGLQSHKDTMDGSQVYDYWLAGKKQEIYDYCAQDVELTRLVHKRLS